MIALTGAPNPVHTNVLQVDRKTKFQTLLSSISEIQGPAIIRPHVGVLGLVDASYVGSLTMEQIQEIVHAGSIDDRLILLERFLGE